LFLVNYPVKVGGKIYQAGETAEYFDNAESLIKAGAVSLIKEEEKPVVKKSRGKDVLSNQ